MNSSVEERADAGEEYRGLAEQLRPILSGLTLVLRRDVGHLLVSPSQATVLAVLLDGPRRMSDLTQYVGVTQPSMTVLVDRMERQGWVRRLPDPTDRRVVRVEITPAGRDAIAEVQEARVRSLARRLAALTDAERVAIAGALPALAALVNR